MIKIDPVRLWGISDFKVTEGYISGGSIPCLWCDHEIEDGSFAPRAE